MYHDIRRTTLCPRNTAVPPTSRHSAYSLLRMQTLHFMKIWKEMSVPPDSTTSAYNTVRMQTSHFTTHVDSTAERAFNLDCSVVCLNLDEKRSPATRRPRSVNPAFSSSYFSKRKGLFTYGHQYHEDRSLYPTSRAQVLSRPHELALRFRPVLVAHTGNLYVTAMPS